MQICLVTTNQLPFRSRGGLGIEYTYTYLHFFMPLFLTITVSNCYLLGYFIRKSGKWESICFKTARLI